jgi:signal transduction histidine kinase
MVVLLLIGALFALPPAVATLTTLAAVAVATLHWCATRRLRRRATRTAHEVRQPLTAALLALHGAARRGEVPPRVVASLELELRRAAFALADPSEATPADVDLHDLLTAQAQTWRDVAAAHGATLDLEPGPGTPVVHADTLRLAQATSNVLANAIEHGGGQITIRTVAIGDRIRIEVSDGGPGLPASIGELSRRPRGRHGHGLSIATSALHHTNGHLAATSSGIAIDLPAKAAS